MLGRHDAKPSGSTQNACEHCEKLQLVIVHNNKSRVRPTSSRAWFIENSRTGRALLMLAVLTTWPNVSRASGACATGFKDAQGRTDVERELTLHVLFIAAQGRAVC